MRLLVTGGTGYLGQAVVRAFAAHGHEPVVFARTAAASGLPGRLVDGDVRDVAALDRAAAGCDAICHMAALVAVWRRRREDFDEINVGGLRNVLQIAAARGTTPVLYTSSFLALPPSDAASPLRANDYQRTKLDAERVAASAAAGGDPIIRLYPGVLYGPGPLTEGNLVGRLLADHLHGRLPGLIGADRIWSYAYVEDVAAGYVAALERGRPGDTYRLGGANVPQMRLFEIVREQTGRRPPRRIPDAVAGVLGVAEELRARLLHGTPKLTRGTLEILRHDWALDSSQAAADLGYVATRLEDGVARTLATLGAAA